MRTPAARVGIAVAAVAAAVALFFALAGGEEDAATARPQTPQATVGTPLSARAAAANPEGAPTTAKRASAELPKPRIHRIWVRDGKPAGGFRRLQFKRGELVRFSVHSQVADEVHIHGYEITKPLPAKRIVLFAFSADLEGVFEVELHEANVEIAELRITP